MTVMCNVWVPLPPSCSLIARHAYFLEIIPLNIRNQAPHLPIARYCTAIATTGISKINQSIKCIIDQFLFVSLSLRHLICFTCLLDIFFSLRWRGGAGTGNLWMQVKGCRRAAGTGSIWVTEESDAKRSAEKTKHDCGDIYDDEKRPRKCYDEWTGSPIQKLGQGCWFSAILRKKAEQRHWTHTITLTKEPASHRGNTSLDCRPLSAYRRAGGWIPDGLSFGTATEHYRRQCSKISCFTTSRRGGGAR